MAISVDEYLALTSPAEQVARLAAAGHLNSTSLTQFLDDAETLVGDDPGRAEALVDLVQVAATALPADELLPRAAYLRAQIRAIQGDFAAAEALILEARESYLALNLTEDALRTTVGLIRVLGETGRYQEALRAAEAALAQINAPNELPEHSALAALLLQNCGYCYDQLGRYAEALTAYDAAESRYTALDMGDQRVQIVENRGLVLVALGQVSAGLAAFETAYASYLATEQTLYQAQTLINIGEAQLLLSNYMASLQAFEAANQRLGALGDTVDQWILLRQLADAYLALNLHSEAEAAYRQAIDALAAGGLKFHQALGLWGLGIVLLARRRLSAADEALTAAIELLRTLDNQPLLATLLIEASRLREMNGDLPSSRKWAAEALALVIDSSWTVQKIYAHLRMADLAMTTNSEEAAAQLTQAQRLVDELNLPHLRYRLDQRWGQLYALQGERTLAQHHLQAAINEIERLRSTLVHERLRASFLQDKIGAYEQLANLHLQESDPRGIRAAFAVAEQAKSRALAELIADGLQRHLDATMDEAVAAELRQLQTELSSVYNAMLGAPDDNSLRTATTAALQTRAMQLEQTISQLQLRSAVARTAAVSAKPVRTTTPKSPAWPEPMVLFHTLGDEILAFVQVGDQLELVRHLTTVGRIEELAQRLAVQWSRFRIRTQLIAAHAEQLERSARRLLQQLYNELMAPIVNLLRELLPATPDVHNLVIVPHGLLHRLPFHAFHDGERYLVEQFAISYAPSAAIFALCQQRPRRESDAAVILAAADPRIPAAEAEALAVAEHLQKRFSAVQVLMRGQATLSALRAVAGDCAILHLACHGLFRRDNPMFSALKLDDAWLMAADVAQLDLRGALVTLSACESGRSSVVAGDEILGLTYAFLSAGVASLLVSQWLVQDAATAALMERWYGHLTEATDLALALRNAQLDLMQDYPHPYYWAPFVLMGKRTSDEGVLKKGITVHEE